MTWDLIVAGAGPAGALTALLAARQLPGGRVLLLDAAEEPRRKPCGEFLSPDGLRILAAAGLEAAVMATGALPLSGLDLEGPRGGLRSDYLPVLGRAPFRPYGVGLRRERFDRVVQDAAAGAADLRRGTRLLAVERCPAGWRLGLRDARGDRTEETRLLVGADGRQSLVRHRTGLDRPVGRQRFALVCRARGIPVGGHGEMHLGPLGQVGLAPLGEGEVNLNLLLAGPSRSLLRHRPPDVLMRAALRATPTLRQRTAGAVLGPVLATGSLPQRSRAVVADGLALVGDAAGFCDPFTGEGICFALQGAESLAPVLAAALAGTPGPVPATSLAAYAQAYRRRFAWRRSLAEVLQRLLGRRPWPSTWWA